jgi:UDP-3-O-[3-hydroxymyristoyl] glucosamine N-acyltransferase
LKTQIHYTLGELADLLEVSVRGDPQLLINGLATLRNAKAGHLSFLSNPRYVSQVADCKASALIIHPSQADASPCACLLSQNPYVTYARASQLFDSAPQAQVGIHSSASVDSAAILGEGVSVGANAVVAAGAEVGAGTVVGAGCSIGRNARIGNNCTLFPNVTVYHEVQIGDRCILHASVVIGADGFGFAFDGRKSVKIAQLGTVRIADDVEIGAGSTIDRGALDDTVIEQGVKIDNQVQIGHNCVIGAHTVICGCTAIAGSTRLGNYCTIGGAVGIVGHLTIADKVIISAMSLVSQSISKPGIYSSGTGLMPSAEWKKNIVRFGQLNDMSRRLRDLERITRDA